MPYQNDTTSPNTATPTDTVLAMLKGAIQSLDTDTLKTLLSEQQLEDLTQSSRDHLSKNEDESNVQYITRLFKPYFTDEQLMDYLVYENPIEDLLSSHFSDHKSEVREWVEGNSYKVFSKDDTQAMQEWLENEHGIYSFFKDTEAADWLRDEHNWGFVAYDSDDIDLCDLCEDGMSEYLSDQGWIVYPNTDEIEPSIFATEVLVQYLRNRDWLVYANKSSLVEDLSVQDIIEQAEGVLPASALLRMLTHKIAELEDV